jgi:RND family efflux transporter MFP subunit
MKITSQNILAQTHMKRVIPFFILLLAVALFAGCGNKAESGAGNLEAKRAELNKLRNNVMGLNQQIRQLEDEIALLDTSNARAVKMISVKTRELKPETLEHFVRVQGKVEAKKNIMVGSKVPGVITQIFVREGQQVSTGQTLAQIDDAVLTSGIDELKTSLDLATILFEKQERLWKQEIGTQVQYLTAKNQKESLERKLSTMYEQKDMYKIKSPISGTVDEVFSKLGENASPGMPSFRVINFSDLSLKANLAESYIPFVKRNDPVKVNFPTINKEMDARVSVVGQEIDPGSRTFSVEVNLPGNPMIKPNMFGELAINDRTAKDAIAVPISLVQKSENGDFVYVAEQNNEGSWIALRRIIKTGVPGKDKVEVLDGLKAGDMLIIAGWDKLSDGQPISITNGENTGSVLFDSQAAGMVSGSEAAATGVQNAN